MKSAAAPAKARSKQSVNPDIPAFQKRHSRAELAAIGKALRDKCPRVSHAEWKPPKDRPDPVRLLEQSDRGRVPELMPLRHGRMLQSPFRSEVPASLARRMEAAEGPA